MALFSRYGYRRLLLRKALYRRNGKIAFAHPEAARGLIGARDHSVGVCRTRFADPGRSRCDGERRDSPRVKWSESGDARFIDPDPSVVERGSEGVHAQRRARIAANETPVRSGDHDASAIGGLSQRRGIDQHHLAPSQVKFRSRLAERLGLASRKRRGAKPERRGATPITDRDPGCARQGVSAAYDAAGHHIPRKPNPAGEMGHGRRCDSQAIEIRERCDPGLILPDSGVVEDNGARLGDGHEDSWIAPGMRPGYDDAATRRGWKLSHAIGKDDICEIRVE